MNYQVKINGQEIDLLPDQALPFTRQGVLSFLGNSGATMIEHFEVPLTDRNKAALKYVYRLNHPNNRESMEIQVLKNGVELFSGECRMGEGSQDRVKLFCGSGRSVFYSRVYKKNIRQYEYHAPIYFANKLSFQAFMQLYFTSPPEGIPNPWFCVFPVYVDSVAQSSVGIKSGGRCFGQNNFYMAQDPGIPTQYNYGIITDKFISTFYRLHMVLWYILQAEGYAITDNWFALPDNEDIVIYNNYDVTSADDFADPDAPRELRAYKSLPDMTVKAFLEAIERYFNVTFIFDLKTVRIVKNDEQVSIPPKVDISQWVSRTYKRQPQNGYSIKLAKPAGDSFLDYGTIKDTNTNFTTLHYFSGHPAYTPYEGLIAYDYFVDNSNPDYGHKMWGYFEWIQQDQNGSGNLVYESLIPGKNTFEIGGIERDGDNVHELSVPLGIPTMFLGKFIVITDDTAAYWDTFNYMPRMDVSIYNRYIDEFKDIQDPAGLFLIKNNGLQQCYWKSTGGIGQPDVFHYFNISHGTVSLAGAKSPDQTVTGFCLRWFNDENLPQSGMFYRMWRQTQRALSNSVAETVRTNMPADMLLRLPTEEPIRYNDANWVIKEIRQDIRPRRGEELSEIDLIKV